MHDPQLFLIILGALLLWGGGVWVWRFLRRRAALRAPFPENWLAIVQRRLPIYQHMPEDVQRQLQRAIQDFLVRKEFVGCAGLEVTEEMRVTVAACACLLLLNRPTSGFKQVRWIYLYPAEFVVRHTVQDAAGVVSQQRGIFSGEAWNNGRVILSWSDVERGVYDFNDGRNVVLHEFAHQLDGESGSMNGAPLLYSKGAYGSWATILSREYQSLQADAYFGKADVLDSYGASSPAEFFAVATESFFEEPEALQQEHPELYGQLTQYYRVDPLEWRPKPQAAKSVPPASGSKGQTPKPDEKTPGATGSVKPSSSQPKSANSKAAQSAPKPKKA